MELNSFDKNNSTLQLSASENVDCKIDISSTSTSENVQDEQNKNLFSHQQKSRIRLCFLASVIVAYLAFFIAVIAVPSRKQTEDYWCNGDGFLIILTLIGTLGWIYFKVFKVYVLKKITSQDMFKIFANKMDNINLLKNNRFSDILSYIVPLLVICAFIVIDCIMTDQLHRLISAVGVAVLLAIAVLASTNRKMISVKLVVWGILLQCLFGILILRWPVGKSIFECLGNKISIFLNFANQGSAYTFGSVISELHTYAFSIMPMIIFFSMVVSMLFYLGILPWIIAKLGWILESTLGTTPCESMACATNIFLGQSESPLIIYPYLSKMTKSEICAVITGGHATVAGTIFAAYISYGVEPAHLISASVMSAPAALVMSKIVYPETENSITKSENIKIGKGPEKNILQAMTNGILLSLPLIGNILACLISFIALNGCMNAIVDWGCQLLNFEEGTCSIQKGMAFPIMPISWVIGIPWQDCYRVSYLFATKFVVSELISYKEMMEMFNAGLLSARSVVVSTYALCGFSGFPSMGAVIGIYSYLMPSRIEDITQIGIRAGLAGNLACFLTACIAGLLTNDDFDPAPSFNSITTNNTNLEYETL